MPHPYFVLFENCVHDTTTQFKSGLPPEMSSQEALEGIIETACELDYAIEDSGEQQATSIAALRVVDTNHTVVASLRLESPESLKYWKRVARMTFDGTLLRCPICYPW